MAMPIEVVKLNFDGCALGAPRQLGIGGVIRDHQGSIIPAYSKPAGDGFLFRLRL